jgi:hypothetical protein
MTFAFYLVAGTFADMQNVVLKLVLNNLLIALFVFIIYKLEFDNLKKLNANGSPAH